MIEYVPLAFLVAPRSAKLTCIPSAKVATPELTLTIELPFFNSTGLEGDTRTKFCNALAIPWLAGSVAEVGLAVGLGVFFLPDVADELVEYLKGEPVHFNRYDHKNRFAD